jgi:hypothetical protein
MILNTANVFYACTKEGSCVSTVPSVVYTPVWSHMDGSFRRLKDVSSELCR